MSGHLPGLRSERRGAALWLTLCEDASRNSLDGDRARALSAELTAVGADERTKLVVLDHDGPIFCSGVHRRYLPALGIGDPATVGEGDRRDLDDVHAAIRAIHECAVPVVALVDGSLHGGVALAMALAAHVVVSTPNARVALLPPQEDGIRPIPDFGALWLASARLGEQEALRLLLTPQTCPPEITARALGERVADRRAAIERITAIASELSGQSQASIAAFVRTLRAEQSLDLLAGAAEELRENQRLLGGTTAETDLLPSLLALPKAVLSTHGLAGRIHSVPVYFIAEQNRVLISSYRAAQKVRNLERDPRASVLVERGTGYHDLAGALLTGSARLLEDGEQAVTDLAARVFAKYRGHEPGEADRQRMRRQASKRVAIEFRWGHVTTWDHSRPASR